MNKNTFILVLTLFASGCDSGFPRIHVDYDHLPAGELRDSIIKTFPTPPDKENMQNRILSLSNGGSSREKIRNAASQMGMICHKETDICEYRGYVRTKATGGISGSGRAKHIYNITIIPETGVNSLKVERQIVEDSEKGS